MSGGIRGLLAASEALEKQIMYAVFYFVNLFNFFLQKMKFFPFQPHSTLDFWVSFLFRKVRKGEQGGCKNAPILISAKITLETSNLE